MKESEKNLIPGVKLVNYATELPVIEVETPLASAKISLCGAHIFSFIPAGEKEILWVSRKAEYMPGKAIRGGVPVCWPWFGSERAGAPAHGFVRKTLWTLADAEELRTGAIRIVLTLTSDSGTFPLSEFPFRADMIFTIGKSLEVTLVALNCGDKPVKTGGALHTYFSISDISKVAISGLDQVPYQEYAADAPRIDGWIQDGDIHVSGEIDRVYCPTQDTVEIVDPGFGRVIRIEKSGSSSTVVWNPALEKAAQMSDFDPPEFTGMLCVESANARSDNRILKPGIPHILTQKITLA